MMHLVLELTLHLNVSSGARCVPIMFCPDPIHNFRAVGLFIKYIPSDCDIKGLEL